MDLFGTPTSFHCSMILDITILYQSCTLYEVLYYIKMGYVMFNMWFTLEKGRVFRDA